jgi:hypothetical protein
MVTGKIFFSSSNSAMSIGLVTFLGGVMSGEAPKAICRALAPIILALSNLVSLGGPIIIALFPFLFA